MTTTSTPRTAAPAAFAHLTDAEVLERFLELAEHTNRVGSDRAALRAQAALKAELNRRHG